MNRIPTLLLLCSLLFTACEKEETPLAEEDNQKPVISMAGIDEEKYVVGEVNFTAEVEDEGKVEKVDVYLEDNLLTSLTEAPYSYSFNSADYDDGSYELKIVAVDAAGNQEEVRKKIEISNKLLTLDASLLFSQEVENPDEVALFVVVSDKNGEVVSFEELTFSSGAPYTVSVNSPKGYFQEEFVFTLMAADYGYKEYGLYSYLVPRGQYWQLQPEQDNWEYREELGRFIVNFLNAGEYDRFEIFGSDNSRGFAQSLYEPRLEVPYYQEPPLDYLMLRKNPNDELMSYKYLSDYVPEGEMNFDVNEMDNDFTSYPFPVEDAKQLKMWGEADIWNDSAYALKFGKINLAWETEYRLPANMEFGNYLFELSYVKEGMKFRSLVKTNSPALDYQELSTRFAVNSATNKGASLTFSGAGFDFYTANWYHFNDSPEGEFVTWYLNFPPEFTEIKLFDISEVDETFNPEWQNQLAYYSTSIVDLRQHDSYAGTYAWFMLHGFGRPRFSDKNEFRDIYKKEVGEPAGRMQRVDRKKEWPPFF